MKKMIGSDTLISWPRLKVLAVIDYMNSIGKTPTYRELSTACGIHVNAVSNHVKRLVKAGVISKDNFKARTMRMAYRFEAEGHDNPVQALQENDEG